MLGLAQRPGMGALLSPYGKPRGASLSGEDLARCWGLFQDEPLDGPSPRLVAGEDDYGEFRNADGEFSGKFYVRYQFQEEGEYFNEKVVIV